ncbi:hypothetical protein KCU93_g4586, partial [Aureobasidium melanogenum]
MSLAGIDDDEDAITPAPSLIQTQSDPSIHNFEPRQFSKESGLVTKFPQQRDIADRATRAHNLQQDSQDPVQQASQPSIGKSTMTMPPNSPSDEPSGPKAKAWPRFHMPKIPPLPHSNKHKSGASDQRLATESTSHPRANEGSQSPPQEPVVTRKDSGHSSKGVSIYPWSRFLGKRSENTHSCDPTDVGSSIDDTFDMSGAADPQQQSYQPASSKRRPSLKGLLARKSSNGHRES